MLEYNDPGRPNLSRSFYRAHGLGNDYLVMEAGSDWVANGTLVEAICHRTEGIGSDGVVALLTTEEPFRLRMFNPDGSEFERSGNGLRILGSWLHRSGRVTGDPFRVRVGGEEIGMRVHGVEGATYDISVDMGRALVGAEAIGLAAERVGPTPRADREHSIGIDLDGSALAVVPVAVGNPHAVVWGAPEDFAELTESDLHRIGAGLAFDPAFADGVNVQLARRVDASTVDIRIWERGVGPTSASGTSSCATAVAAVASGVVEPGEIRVTMPGGELRVTVSAELDVVLRGPVQAVGEGEIYPEFLTESAG